MSLLYPAALALAAAVVIPLLLHLRREPRQRRIAFPALRYLQQAERSLSRVLRVRDLFVMALRVGVLTLAAFAAAGPLIGRGGAREHPPTDVAIVLDNSASTGRMHGDRIAFELFREVALSSVALAGPADRFWIFPTVGSPLALGVAPAMAAGALRRAQATDGFGDATATLGTAWRSLPSGERKQEVHLVGDLQATGLPPAARSAEPTPGDRLPLVVLVVDGLSEQNSAVTAAVSSEGTSLPAGLPAVLEVEATQFHEPAAEDAGEVAEDASEAPPEGRGASADSARLRVDLDGRAVDATTSGWGERAYVQLPELDAGSHHVRIELQASGLRSDDARHLTLQVREPPTVELLGPADGFLAAALETLSDAGRIGESRETVAILQAAPQVTVPPQATRTARAVIYVPPTDPIALPLFNQRLADASVPWTLATDSARGELGLERTRSSVPGEALLAAARVFQRYRLERVAPAAGDTVLIRTSAGDPWLVRGRTSTGRYLVLGSPLDPSSSTVPTSALMVPLAERLLRWALASDGEAGHHLAGERIRVPAGVDSIRRPDGLVLRVDSGTPLLLSQAGLYRAYGGEGSPSDGASLLAANVPAGEHDLRALSPRTLRERLPDVEIVTAGPGPEDWRREVFRSRRGREATVWIIGLVALLLLTETLVVTPGFRDRRSAS